MKQFVRTFTLAAAACSLCLLAALPVLAQSYAVEGLAPGALAGQDGWSGSSSATVDGALFSPLDGSRQSIRFRGTGGFISVSRAIGTTIASGFYRISYDLFVTPRVSATTNQVMRVGLDQANGVQVFGPYAQDGGAGIAQNGFVDSDGLGGAGYGPWGDLVTPGFRYQANRWYRFEVTLDFDTARILTRNIYDISSGSAQLVANSERVFYFNNTGTTFFTIWSRLTLGLDPAVASEGWNFDNFYVTALSPGTAIPTNGILFISAVNGQATAGQPDQIDIRVGDCVTLTFLVKYRTGGFVDVTLNPNTVFFTDPPQGAFPGKNVWCPSPAVADKKITVYARYFSQAAGQTIGDTVSIHVLR